MQKDVKILVALRHVDKYFTGIGAGDIVILDVCKNPRCITSTEQGLDHVFYLANEEKRIYRCLYCETKVEKKQKQCFYFYAGVAPMVEQLTRNQQAVGSNPISSTIIKINNR